KNGAVHFPKSRQWILPALTIKARTHKPPSAAPAQAAKTAAPRFKLHLPKFGFSMRTRHTPLAPKLHISRSLSTAAKAYAPLHTAKSALPSMKLKLPQLGQSMRPR